jgi:Uncharacterized alpha/beta hydrolase domain (DUF2235)
MSWVRHFFEAFFLPLTSIVLTGGYEFLMENCRSFGNSRADASIDLPVLDHANDKVCIFGFSRGAYTARALAGMIHKVGARYICISLSWSNVTRLVIGGLAPCGEPPASSLRIQDVLSGGQNWAESKPRV